MSMLGKEYLVHGLNAMSRAHEGDYFRDGHVAGAVISAYYFCRDTKAEDGVADILAARISENWLQKPLFAPPPDQTAEPELVTRILNAMRENVTEVLQAGHNLILPTLALKAFHDVPEAVTESRVAGICALVRSFQRGEFPMDEDRDMPVFDDPRMFAEFILREFVACTERFIGRGQGWSGHLLTNAAALLDLRDLRYTELARCAEDSIKMYVRRIRLGPLNSDKPREEHKLIAVFPTERAYWERKSGGDWALGHVLKYPYGFYRLMDLAQDAELKKQSLRVAYRIF